MKNHDLTLSDNDPEIHIKLPSTVVKDLVLRAQENGASIEMEFAKRLARSLERDLQMIEEDNHTALIACNTAHHYPFD